MNSFNSLKFCYYYFSQMANLLHSDIDSINSEMISCACQRLQLSPSSIYLFDKSGHPLSSIFQLTSHTLILSQTAFFHGLHVFDHNRNEKIAAIVGILELPLKGQMSMRQVKTKGFHYRILEDRIMGEYQESKKHIKELFINGYKRNKEDNQEFQIYQNKLDYLENK